MEPCRRLFLGTFWASDSYIVIGLECVNEAENGNNREVTRCLKAALSQALETCVRTDFQAAEISSVTLMDKLLFIVPVGLYWVLPDFMPFIPIDDIAVTMIAAEWFTRRMEKKYGTG